MARLLTPSLRPLGAAISGALVAILDPDVVLRADGGATGLSHYVRGAEEVARQATMWAQVDLTARRALVNGAAGMVADRNGKTFSVGAFTIRDGKIVEFDILVDPDRIAQLELDVLQD